MDISAPGGQTGTGTANGILSTLNSGAKAPSSESYAYYQGTSMATPHIAGLVALMKSANSSLTPARIEAAIRANARALPGSCSGGGSTDGTTVGVNIAHTYRGDLVIDLVVPDGTAYRLKGAGSSDSADNVDTTYTVDASGETAGGGTLNRWQLTF